MLTGIAILVAFLWYVAMGACIAALYILNCQRLGYPTSKFTIVTCWVFWWMMGWAIGMVSILDLIFGEDTQDS